MKGSTLLRLVSEKPRVPWWQRRLFNGRVSVRELLLILGVYALGVLVGRGLR